MTSAHNFSVRITAWHDTKDVLSRIRIEVFTDEQRLPPEIEIDGLDPECVHVLAESLEGEAIGTGRLMPDGRIGRMAVLPAWRKTGVGGALLRALMDAAKRRGESSVHLHAQSHACDFYRRHGFVIVGDEHEEAGILHVNMRALL